MAMYDAPPIALTSEDPCGANLKERLHSMAWDFEAHILKLHYVAEVAADVRRNSRNRQGPIRVLRPGPVESRPDLIPPICTTSAGDAKQRDLGLASPEGLEGLRTASKQFGFCFADLFEKGIELCTPLI